MDPRRILTMCSAYNLYRGAHQVLFTADTYDARNLWILEEYSDIIYQASQNIFPVLDRDTLIGVIDRKNIQETIAWIRMRVG